MSGGMKEHTQADDGDTEQAEKYPRKRNIWWQRARVCGDGDERDGEANKFCSRSSRSVRGRCAPPSPRTLRIVGSQRNVIDEKLYVSNLNIVYFAPLARIPLRSIGRCMCTRTAVLLKRIVFQHSLRRAAFNWLRRRISAASLAQSQPTLGRTKPTEIPVFVRWRSGETRPKPQRECTTYSPAECRAEPSRLRALKRLTKHKCKRSDAFDAFDDHEREKCSPRIP